tara:strand:+ start:870 stop:1250 length:381 start_codon:yes stop_codon:yes gene_type:complete
MDYKTKYLKYKAKYLNTKKQIKGGWLWGEATNGTLLSKGQKREQYNKILAENYNANAQQRLQEERLEKQAQRDNTNKLQNSASETKRINIIKNQQMRDWRSGYYCSLPNIFGQLPDLECTPPPKKK